MMNTKIPEIVALCRETSAIILSFYGQQEALQIEQKKDKTLLTQADIEAHHHLNAHLGKIIDIPIISEESLHHYPAPNDYWLIDPIDGTQQFVEKTGEFCISLTRIVNHRPILGLIYAPISGEYWWAEKNQGAFYFDGNSIINIKTNQNASPLRLLTARKNISKGVKSFAQNVLGLDYQHLTKGSALKFCLLAMGKADCYVKLSSTTSEWDISAGDLILHEAGGKVLSHQNELLFYGTKANLLNPPFIAMSGAFNLELEKKALQVMNELILK